MSVKKLCVLGHGISYTLSPRLHAEIFRALGIEGEYHVADVSPEDLESTVKRLLCEYDGFNITKPYKEAVAKILGSDKPINTVRHDGKYTSTDAEGFISDYTSAFGEPRGKILLLGAGGAAKSVAEGLCKYKDAEIYVYNRTYEKAEQMERERITAVKSPEGEYDAVINSTSLGLNCEQAAPEKLSFNGVKFAYDLVYSPPVTPFMEKAALSGARVRNGLGMLVYQAIAAHEFWRGEKFDESERAKLAETVMNKLVK